MQPNTSSRVRLARLPAASKSATLHHCPRGSVELASGPTNCPEGNLWVAVKLNMCCHLCFRTNKRHSGLFQPHLMRVVSYLQVQLHTLSIQLEPAPLMSFNPRQQSSLDPSMHATSSQPFHLSCLCGTFHMHTMFSTRYLANNA
jgi:hypothetical protein